MLRFKKPRLYHPLNCILCVILISTFYGCDSREERKEFYSNGNLKSIAEFKGEQMDGELVEYYEDGTVKTLSSWKDGKQHGKSTLNYPSGKVESTSLWKDGKLDGYYEHFFENGNYQGFGYYSNGVKDGTYSLFHQNGSILQKGSFRDGIRNGEQRVYDEKGNLKSIKHFLNFKGEEVLAGYVFFNEDGTIREESARTEIIANEDTIAIGEPLEVTMVLKKPHFDSTHYIVGMQGFDDKFNLYSPNSFDTLKAKDHKVVYQVVPKQVGSNYLRGYVNNFEIKDIQGDTITTISNHTYFEHPFFVTE